MNHRRLISTAIVLGCSACGGSLGNTSGKPAAVSVEEGRAFFDRYVALSQAFAQELETLYDPEARIRTVRHSSEGDKELEVTGAQWKEAIAVALPLAKRAGEVNRFTDVSVSARPSGAEIKAKRYSVTRCTLDTDYQLLVGRNDAGALQIVEESTHTWAESSCGLGDGKPLAKRLEELSEQLSYAVPLSSTTRPVSIGSRTKVTSCRTNTRSPAATSDRWTARSWASSCSRLRRKTPVTSLRRCKQC